MKTAIKLSASTLFTLFIIVMFFSCSQDDDDASADLGPMDDDGPNDDTDDDADDDADDDVPDCGDHVFEDVTIPMRDEKSLAAFVRRPANGGCRLPTVLLQTPYDKEEARELWFDDTSVEPLFGSFDYAFVVTDWRGFNGSEDAAVEGTPPYEEDGYDTVEWIADQPWSDGQVGLWGVSALCSQQYATAVMQPSALKAAVPIFCEMNKTYENYYPGGVLRTEYTFFVFGYFGADLVMDYPYRTWIWTIIETEKKARDINIPMLVIAGWYDLYNVGTFNTFHSLVTDSAETVRDEHRLLVGDWIHFAVGIETSGFGRPFTDQELYYFDDEKRIQADSLAFFDLHLRGVAGTAAQWEPVRYVYSGDRQWTGSDTWPPPGVTERKYYLSAEGALVDMAPSAGELSYLYNPDDPSPTIGGQTLLPTLYHGPHDQADVQVRGDNLVFVSAPLPEAMRIAGAIRIQIDTATTGADTDFAARLTDVDGDGNHLLIGEGIQRLKLRDDLGTVSEVLPDTRYSLTIRLTNELAYTFAEGHRIGLIISSSNYPRFDANMNTGVNFYANDGTALVATNMIYLDGASILYLPVMEPDH